MKYLELIKKIQSVLSEDLLSNDWKKIVRSGDFHPTTGHCYSASEALYHILGGKDGGFTPQVGKSELGTHWWLKDSDGNILDPTSEQFYYKNEVPPYKNGKGTGFLTKKPSKRAQIIIERMRDNNLDLSNKFNIFVTN